MSHGLSRQNSSQMTALKVTISAMQSPSPAIMPLWALGSMMIREKIPALSISSDEIPTAHGFSRKSLFRMTALKVTDSACPSRSPEIIYLSGLTGMMILSRELIPALSMSIMPVCLIKLLPETALRMTTSAMQWLSPAIMQ